MIYDFLNIYNVGARSHFYRGGVRGDVPAVGHQRGREDRLGGVPADDAARSKCYKTFYGRNLRIFVIS
jgi:hypothetical protein